MRIFGPLPWPTISPVTVTLARAAASLVTVSPSTSRIAGRGTVSPASPVRRFTVNRSPTATLCWLPPAFTTAYTTDSSFLATLFCPAHTLRVVHRGWAGSARPTGTGGMQPDQRTRSGGGRSGRAAGRPAPARPRHRVHLGLRLGLGFRGGLGGGLRLEGGLGRGLGLVGHRDRLDCGDRLVAGRRLLGGRGLGADLDRGLLLGHHGEDGGVLGRALLPRLPAVAPATVAPSAGGATDLDVHVGRRAAVGGGVL